MIQIIHWSYALLLYRLLREWPRQATSTFKNVLIYYRVGFLCLKWNKVSLDQCFWIKVFRASWRVVREKPWAEIMEGLKVETCGFSSCRRRWAVAWPHVLAASLTLPPDWGRASNLNISSTKLIKCQYIFFKPSEAYFLKPSLSYSPVMLPASTYCKISHLFNWRKINLQWKTCRDSKRREISCGQYFWVLID